MLSHPRLGRRVVLRFGRFGLVGLSGLLVNTVAMAVFTSVLHIHYLVAAVVATQVSTTWNFLGSEFWAFTGEAHGRPKRFLAFAAMNNLAFLARFPILWALKEGLGAPALIANLVSLLALTVVRFAVADSMIWGKAKSAAEAEAELAPVVHRVVETPEVRAPLEPAPKRAELLVVGGLLAVGLFLRVLTLMANGLNSDESVYAGQGASMFGLEEFPRFFSLFRAHPLLMQGTVGVVFRIFGPSDVAARLVAVTFGMIAVAATWGLARELFGKNVGLISLGLVAVLPYHSLVSRQVLVDTPMGAMVAVSFWALARGTRRGSHRWIVTAAAVLGLACLAKETAIIFAPVFVLVLLLERGRRGLVTSSLWLQCGIGFGIALFAFPATRLINKPESAGSFFLWQFTRAPNHSITYFFRALLQFGTPAFAVLGAVGVAASLIRRSKADLFILLWIVPALAFYTIWPTKLFPYLFPILPALCIAGAVAVVQVAGLFARLRAGRMVFTAAVLGVTGALMFGTSWAMATDSTSKAVSGFNDYDVEVQSFAGGRELGEWARADTPADSRFLTIGPSFGNVLRFYGRRDSAALSISTDAKKRNPAYVPVPNPDLTIRNLSVQYLVWDAYSADRTQFYSDRMMKYVKAFGGIPVFSAFIDARGNLVTSTGAPPPDAERRVIVYSVGGVAPVDESVTQVEQ